MPRISWFLADKLRSVPDQSSRFGGEFWVSWSRSNSCTALKIIEALKLEQGRNAATHWSPKWRLGCFASIGSFAIRWMNLWNPLDFGIYGVQHILNRDLLWSPTEWHSKWLNRCRMCQIYAFNRWRDCRERILDSMCETGDFFAALLKKVLIEFLNMHISFHIMIWL